MALNTTDRQVAERALAEIIREYERERAGLIAPRLEREAAQQGLATHQEDFAADLRALGRTKPYIEKVRARFTRLAQECGWRHPGDITANSFVSWRAKHTELSPKTLNEYLNSANVLVNWMVKQGRASINPLKTVTHSDVRGKQQRRRAFTDDELDRLLVVAKPKFRILYMAAAFTGLRIGELQQLVWGDLKMEHERPHIVVRASTTKNRRDAVLPLHPELVKELQATKLPRASAGDFVFVRHPHPDRRIRCDMEKAGITRIDSLGRKLDFHALRYTFATKLAASGVSQRLAQELMRHSDPRLTANIYTDVTLLPTFAAVSALSWQSGSKPTDYTVIDPHNSAPACHNQARSVAGQNVSVTPNAPVNQGFRHVLASFAKGEKWGGRGDLNGELKNTQPVVKQATSETETSSDTVIDPHELQATRGEMVEVRGVEPLCP